MNETIRSAICDMGHDEAIVFDLPGYDEAIIGVTDDGRVVYNYDAMVECLMNATGMNMEQAVDFSDYNTVRACAYMNNAPIIVYPLPVDA